MTALETIILSAFLSNLVMALFGYAMLSLLLAAISLPVSNKLLNDKFKYWDHYWANAAFCFVSCLFGFAYYAIFGPALAKPLVTILSFGIAMWSFRWKLQLDWSEAFKVVIVLFGLATAVILVVCAIVALL